MSDNATDTNQSQQQSDSDRRQVNTLQRSTVNRMIGGVAGGIGEHGPRCGQLQRLGALPLAEVAYHRLPGSGEALLVGDLAEELFDLTPDLDLVRQVELWIQLVDEAVLHPELRLAE